jgi:diaminohydroxyphosphoribosylaminopyrimidine deaminase/5-amino-6-(5-phosphoribosylamino)uracil reductase
VGGRAPGATIYISLEPCAHEDGGRVSCARRVRESGVARMVYGARDPYPGHGGGAKRVRAAGIEVVGPILEADCRRANEAWLVFATEKRPFFTLKAAMTLDGKIATRTGESRWITGETARGEVHALRNKVDAVIVGARTVAVDDPLLTTRGVAGGRDAVRVVLDGRLSMSPRAKMLRSGSKVPTIVVAGKDAPAGRERALVKAGAEVLRLPATRGALRLRALATRLAGRNIVSALVEGGGQTHAAFLAAGLCDRLILYVAPRAVGGDAPSWLGGDGVKRLADAYGFRFDDVRRVGDDLRLEATKVT